MSPKLWDAAQQGVVCAIVRLLVTETFTVQSHAAALRVAVCNDFPQVVAALLQERVVPVNWVYRGSHCRQGTALHYAALYNSIGAARVLLCAGAVVNTPASHGEFGTPLHAAAEMGHVDMVVLLLKNGACVHERDAPFDRTPIFVAACAGRAPSVQLLVEAKANVDAHSCEGTTPLAAAAAKGHVDVAWLLTKAKAHFRAPNDFGDPPIIQAAMCGHTGMVSFLLEAKANVDGGPMDGGAPVFAAARSGHVGIVALLLRAKANVDGGPIDVEAPVFAAARSGHVDIVALLLRAKANVDVAGGDPLVADAIRQGTVNTLRERLFVQLFLQQAALPRNGLHR